MRPEQTDRADQSVSVSLSVPADDPSIYARAATDDVLTFLTRHRYEAFTQRSMAARMDHSESAVRGAVEVLAANGIVEVTHTGRATAVQINRNRIDVPSDPIVRIPQSEFHEPVRTAVSALETELSDLLGIVLYGSVARGEADRRSDIDLWVLVEDDRPANQRRANAVRDELEGRTFDGDRYEFHIAVESLAAVSSFTEDVRSILADGIAVVETDELQKLETILLQDTSDE